VFFHCVNFEVIQNRIITVEGAIIFLLPKYIKNNDMLCENSDGYFKPNALAKRK
jgi:hypothetical protein